MVRYYLNKPHSAQCGHFRCRPPDEFDHVLAQMDEPQGAGRVRRKIQANRRGWIAQPVVQLSAVPSKVDERLARPAAVRGQRRQGDLRAVRRADQGGAAGGQSRGELLAGRRLEGHPGARLAYVHCGARSGPARTQ
ncbi:hypothetical protein [Amycolatopsis sulphurea]